MGVYVSYGINDSKFSSMDSSDLVISCCYSMLVKVYVDKMDFQLIPNDSKCEHVYVMMMTIVSIDFVVHSEQLMMKSSSSLLLLLMFEWDFVHVDYSICNEFVTIENDEIHP